jgi:CMP-N-acetylneuraminic acid synthetase
MINVIAIIPARGNSKRLHRKNIYNIFGEPMIYWSIRACLESQYNIQPWVSTEDTEIKKMALSFGAKVHDRDPLLSEDHVYKQEVIRSSAKYIFENHSKPDIVISLQANSPQIKPHMLDDALDVFLAHDRDEIFSVDNNLMQNAAFRIFKSSYVFQKDLSTNCGVFVCPLHDVHTVEDVKNLEKIERKET